MSGYALNGPDSMTPKHIIFFLIFATALGQNQPSGSHKVAGAWGWPFTYIQHSTPIRFIIRCWLTEATYRCHTYRMPNVIKHSSSRRQFHGPVGAALMHINGRRQTDGHDKAHRRFSDYANAPKNVIKTQMVTMWSRHTIPNSTLPFR